MQAVLFGVSPDSAVVQMPRAYRTTRIGNRQTGPFRFVGQTIVAAGHPERKIHWHEWNRRFEDPRILAAREVIVAERTIRGFIPSRKTKHFPVDGLII